MCAGDPTKIAENNLEGIIGGTTEEIAEGISGVCILKELLDVLTIFRKA